MKQYIYKITILTTNKSYIGITNNPGRRLGQHMHSARINCEGRKNFYKICEELNISWKQMRILLSHKINEWYIPRNHNKDKRSFKLLNKNFINK